MNNLPRVVARIVPRSESNPLPLDRESNALPLHYRVTSLRFAHELDILGGVALTVSPRWRCICFSLAVQYDVWSLL